MSELRSLNPSRDFNLVLIDVTKEELVRERSSRIRDLLYPLETVLDDSIGCAVWFAARARGKIQQPQQQQQQQDEPEQSQEGCHDYQSPARVLILGKFST